MPECSTQEKQSLQCGRETKHIGTMVAVISALSPEPQTPVFLHRTLFHSTLSPVEQRKNASFLSDHSQPNADYLSSTQQAEVLLMPDNIMVPILKF